MKKIIEELCPNGVEYVTIEDICDISRGQVMSKDYIRDNEGEYPVYSSQTENNGELGKISTYMFDGEYLTWTTDGANAGAVFYRNGKFSVTNVCGLLKVKSENILPKFLYYVLNVTTSKYVNKGMGNPKLMSNVMAKIKVPLPPLEAQRKTIYVLDKFALLLSELTMELALRKKQYSELAYQLLKKKNTSPMYFVKDVCLLTKGKTPIQKAIPGEYPMVVTTTERKTCSTYQFDAQAVCIPLVSSRGHGVASLNHVYYQEGKFALGNILCAAIPKDNKMLSAKYLYYYFECTKDYTLVPLMKGGANVSMHIPDIEKLKIPIPNIDIQNDIVKILDKFDKLVNDFSEGLPAEIEARKKQYEYYKNKLLTYKQLS